MQSVFVFNDVDTFNLTIKLVVLDGFLNLFEAEHREVGAQLTVTHDVFARRIDIHAVGRLWTWDEIEEVVDLARVNHFHLV